MNNQLESVPFHADTIYCVEYDGEPYAPVKPIVDNLGLDWKNQSEKLRNTPHFNCGLITIVAKDGKNREMLCIPVRKLTGFLYSINANRVKANLREKLIQYQNECDDVLWKYWNEGRAVRSTVQANVVRPVSDYIDGARLVFESANLTGNQMTIALDRIYRSVTGSSALQEANLPLEAPRKEVMLTPTQIGEDLVPPMKARDVNSLLQQHGYQRKINGMWQPTEKGSPICTMLDVGKRHSKGTPVTQLKWYSSVVDTLQSIINQNV